MTVGLRSELRRRRAPGDVNAAVEALEVEVEGSKRGRATEHTARLRLPQAFRAGSPAWSWIGVGLGAAGFSLIAVTWGQVAGETEVYRQLPYVISGGLLALGLIIIGVVVLAVASRERDARERDQQIEQLAVVVEELRQALADQGQRRR